jgi:hypothetical protein
MNRRALTMAMVLAMGMATAAHAKKPPPPPPPPPAGPTLGSTLCKLTDISANGASATACGGWYSGNLDGGSGAMKTDSADALNTLLGGSAYTEANLSFLQDMDVSGSTINFTAPLYGETIVAFHVGGAKGAGGVGYESTAFYEFDAGDLVGGLDTFTFNLPGLSNARLYSTGTYTPPVCTQACGGGQLPGVPEPATWGLMILGFGGAGALLRRRRAVTA